MSLDISDPSRTKADLLEQLGGALFALQESGIHPVLVIDEAQLVPHKETFDEIRLLTNFQLDDQNLISVVLMGQPELRKRLSHRVYEPLRQRIGMQYELKPLDAEETAEYIRFRMTVASGHGDTFTASAAMKLYQYSGGVPRKINHASGLALLEAFGRESEIVDDRVVDAVLAELSMGV
jgi:type II secretory pathway predicted ATPase ExeA